MVVLTKGKESSVTVLVETSIDLTGFSAFLTVGSLIKTISPFKSGRTQIIFTSDETDSIPLGTLYGTLVIKDSEGEPYKSVYPVFKVSKTQPQYPQSLNITLVGKFKHVSGGGSGGGITEEDLNKAVNTVKKYTDDKIGDIGTVIIETQPVTVEVPGETPVTMTVQEAVQNIIKNNEYIEKAEKSLLQGNIKDEDGDGQPDDDTLYLFTEKH